MNESNICVIFNPASGRGRARDELARLRTYLGSRGEFRASLNPGHAEELARAAADEGFPVVAAAGGDGTVHEVANGVLRSENRDVVLAVLPVGSANDYAYALGLEHRWWERQGTSVGVRQVDVGVIEAPDRSQYFVNGLGLGFNGAVTLESRKIRRLRGVFLYGLALLKALAWRYEHVPLSLSIDGEEPGSIPTLALSLALGQREGNFVVAPEAELDDGLFDYLHIGHLSRFAALGLLPGLLRGKLGEGRHVRQGRCKSVSIRSESALLIHLDGEFFSLAEDDVREVEIRLLENRLRVYGKTVS